MEDTELDSDLWVQRGFLQGFLRKLTEIKVYLRISGSKYSRYWYTDF